MVIYYVQVIVTFVIIQKIKIHILTQCEMYNVIKYNLCLKEYIKKKFNTKYLILFLSKYSVLKYWIKDGLFWGV